MIITIILVLQLLIVQQLATGFSFNTPPPQPPPPTNNNNDRRDFLLQTTSATISLLLVPTQIANALVDISSSPPSPPPTSNIYDRPRNVNLDKFFANGMATEMVGYEERAKPYKQKIFQSLFASLSKEENTPQPTIVEVGMGTFPNAPYYAQGIKDNPSLQGFDIISVDPNDYMHSYAIQSAEKSGLISSSSTSKTTTLRNVHGVAEALPFDDNSIDAVVGTLTLCSVTDQNRALQEIARVLKPTTGKYLFWEHVLSENDTGLMVQQKVLSPLQTLVADGCHLNRRTGMNIVNSGLFHGGVDMEYIVLDEGGIIAPTSYGIATA